MEFCLSRRPVTCSRCARSGGTPQATVFLCRALSLSGTPPDETPGAKEAGVVEFIDFMVANRVAVSPHCEIRSIADAIRQGDDAQQQLLAGLDWINARSKSEFGKVFLDCTDEQHANFLEELAYKGKFKPTTESGCEFFRLIRDYTVVGYYTSKIGLESLGYPGLHCVAQDAGLHACQRSGASPPGNPEMRGNCCQPKHST